ncbi:ATP-binding cassette domain-containing protein [Algoriphagus sanaruensis]|uniref:Molybdenum ABC transporter ATP-binding protein n=1 Tax=Algoriphagus sanaruensis TaxID=1727163 RepID=A0A142ER91_9BACT|nr:ATP-binding cassette domain-containing protein [Algoriphagus sanaruensis]AMQ57646.1 molybdenum ABC transporter ATP-binding protein [Algoriphagus sanaruensis]
MTSKILLEIENAQVNYLGKATFYQLNFIWQEGQQWAITGDSGRELTAFLETLRGSTHLPKGRISRTFASEYIAQKTDEGSVHSFRDLIAYVSQQYRFRNKSNLQNFYFQQRFNSSEADEAATVSAYLKENSTPIPGPWTLEKVAALFRLTPLLDSSILMLSNGETRRLALALGLLRQPKIYLMDQPMTGLDQESRAAFGDFLKAIISEGIHVLITTSSAEIPEGITHVGELKSSGKIQIWERENYSLNKNQSKDLPWNSDVMKALLEGLPKAENEVIRLENVSIRYGEKTILNQVNWQVNPGERWQLKGKNGSGKSTLISLLIGENPQAYSQNFWLFGRKRGSGESIWDVKRPIGFVAPELVRFFPSNQTVRKVILSGFFDTMGLFKKTTAEQESKMNQWLQLFNLETFANLPIQRIPLEQQRWTLLARALIKAPKLLILDEASQGMDERQRVIFRETVQKILELTPITLIYVSHYQEDIPENVDRIFELS